MTPVPAVSKEAIGRVEHSMLGKGASARQNITHSAEDMKLTLRLR